MAHHRAGFINAIREEGTKSEACDYLQKTWNDLCDLRKASNEAQSLINQVIAELRTPEELNREDLWTILQDARNRIADVQIEFGNAQ